MQAERGAKMQAERDYSEAVLSDLARTFRLLAAEVGPASVSALSSDRLRDHAAIAFGCAQADPSDRHAAMDILAVELLKAACLDLGADVASARRLAARMEHEFGVHPAVIARGLLRSLDILSLPPRVATSTQLARLMMLAPLDEVSVWAPSDAGPVHRVCDAGVPADEAEVANQAESLLAPGRRRILDGDLVGVVIEQADGRVAALIGRGEPIFHDRMRALLSEAAPVLAAALEREQLLARDVEMQRALTDPRDRRLTRLGLDVHDGPLQDLAVLGQDLSLFRNQLRGTLEGHHREALLIGRLDDLEAQLVAVDSDLRRLAVSLQSPFLIHADFGRALREIVEAFRVASGITPDLHLTGDIDRVGETPQMTLLSIVREALSNVRKHSHAGEVAIRVTADREGVRAEVSDNGHGFDVENALIEAARGGHLGLAGMHERVRLLDGNSRIDSRPGGPTTITIELPRRQPLL
jgi:signal transduction histidine kinase